MTGVGPSPWWGSSSLAPGEAGPKVILSDKGHCVADLVSTMPHEVPLGVGLTLQGAEPSLSPNNLFGGGAGMGHVASCRLFWQSCQSHPGLPSDVPGMTARLTLGVPRWNLSDLCVVTLDSMMAYTP